MKTKSFPLFKKLLPATEKKRTTLKLIAGNLCLLFACIWMFDCNPLTVPKDSLKVKVVGYNGAILEWQPSESHSGVTYKVYHSVNPLDLDDEKTAEAIIGRTQGVLPRMSTGNFYSPFVGES